MESKRAGVLMDVDGTLVDSNYLHTIAWSRAFADLGIWAPSNAIHRLVGMGGDELVTELFGRDVDGASAAWKRHYEALMEEVQPLPGAAELLRCLADNGVVVVLATSSPAEHLHAVRKLLDADEAIDAVTTSDDVSTSKPEPDIFSAALEAGSIDRGYAIAVGDSIWDVRAARRAGLGCIGLETGGFSSHELDEEGALHVYHDAGELAVQLRTSPIAQLLDR